jgi:hypothetical protein
MTTDPPQRLISDQRGVRYGEILAVSAKGTSFEAEVYGSQLLHDCPQEWWETLDPTAIAAELGALVVKLNGPRYWMLDGLGQKVAVTDPLVRDFNALPMRRIAVLDLGQDPTATPYTERHVNRGAVFFFDAGSAIHELVRPDGTAYVMQAYCTAVDPSLTQESLAGLGERLALPEDWTYRTQVLDHELIVDTSDTIATVVQDELENTYTLPD